MRKDGRTTLKNQQAKSEDIPLRHLPYPHIPRLRGKEGPIPLERLPLSYHPDSRDYPFGRRKGRGASTPHYGGILPGARLYINNPEQKQLTKKYKE